MIQMEFKLTSGALLIIHILGVVLAFVTLALLYQIDMIVHGSLYGYGLIFSEEWAIAYWTFQRLALGLLVVIAVVNSILAVHSFRSLRKEIPVVLSTRALTKAKETRPEPTSPTRPKRGWRQEDEEAQKEASRIKEDDGVEVIAALPMVCNKCGKVFTQPLCMFDFKSGKPRLVNVCPYCSAILAVSGNSKDRP